MSEAATHHAAIDLGSNSFHMVVAHHDGHQLRIVDRLKDMVRLAGGIDRNGRLDPIVRERALSSLARFGQRISGIPRLQVRAVGTQSFRRLAHPATFLVVAETALGCPIDIISGSEEARLVYLGVHQGTPIGEGRSLIIDIGGGSTELAVGADDEPELTETVPAGCVSITEAHFHRGKITASRFRKAVEAVEDRLVELITPCRDLGWERVIGSSGTMRAIASMAADGGEDARSFTRADLERLRDRVIAAGQVDRIDLPGLSARRKPVIVGGLAVLEALSRALDLDRFEVSQSALREGLLHDLIGRLHHTDPRARSVAGMAERLGCDSGQAARVHEWVQAAFDQVADGWQLGEDHRELLLWAAQLHEVGRSVNHHHHQKHGGYLVANADMPGFTRPEQRFMAALIALQRGKIDTGVLEWVPQRMGLALTRLGALLRIAVTLARPRSDAAMPDFSLSPDDEGLLLGLPPSWLDAHPLSARSLSYQQRKLARLGLDLDIRDLTDVEQATG
ncbi:MAG: exopolyphosphatase [Gammaproteobacteria bacterium]|jgi:exopolyphosphatase/guanosine-5'-triphosphate,3'-diphosphate pyrophosphatase|nr:exopolyphosphatase [Gammaproteobacteria bacterium]